jgi:hypothetical protein
MLPDRSRDCPGRAARRLRLVFAAACYFLTGLISAKGLLHRPDRPVRYTIGSTANTIVHNGRLDPGRHLISKHFTYAELASKVRRMLDVD